MQQRSFYSIHDSLFYLYKIQDYTAKLSDLGLAKDGPEGEDTHLTTTCIMGTRGYAAPEYIMSGVDKINFVFCGHLINL